MNTNKIASLYNQIEKADRIFSVNNSAVIGTLSFELIEGKPDNEVIYFGWEDDIGNEFSVKITEEGLNNSTVLENGCISLIDSEGDEFVIRLIEYKNLDAIQDW